MAVQVDRFKLSLIWFETVLDLLQEKPPKAPMRFLGRNYTYEPRFADAIKEQVAMLNAKLQPRGELAPPWPKPIGQRFWMYYLKKRKLDEVSGREAWNALVPFRIRPRFTVQATAPVDGVLSEGFAYPHGFAWVLTLGCSGAFTPEEMASTAQELRRTCQLTVTWDAGSSEQCSLDVLAGKAMQTLRRAIFGASVAAGTALAADPFTVLTVLQASGIDAETPVQPGSVLQKTLEAVTNWRPTWKKDPPPKLSKVDVDRRTGPAGHMIYGRKRGRAVWFPASFQPPVPGRRAPTSLGCYHRNMVFASLQGESLLGLLAATAQAGPILPAAHDNCANNAAGIMGRLYGGVEDTYRSGSLRAQVDQQGLVTTVNTVRARYKMSPLA